MAVKDTAWDRLENGIHFKMLLVPPGIRASESNSWHLESLDTESASNLNVVRFLPYSNISPDCDFWLLSKNAVFADVS